MRQDAIHSITTHEREFHAHDVLATGIIRMLFPEATTTRTSNRLAVATAIMDPSVAVVAVGEVNDPDSNNFDHDHKGRAGTRANGVPYSSLGLVWKKFGPEYCRSILVMLEPKVPIDLKELAASVDSELIEGVDAMDRRAVPLRFQPRVEGTEVRVHIQTLCDAICGLNPDPIFAPGGEPDYNAAFLMAVEIGQKLFVSAVTACAAKIYQREIIKLSTGQRTADPKANGIDHDKGDEKKKE